MQGELSAGLCCLIRGATLVVGDVSFLHDVNGLNLLRTGVPPPATPPILQKCLVPGYRNPIT